MSTFFRRASLNLVRICTVALCAGLALQLGGCGNAGYVHERQVDYKKVRTLAPLEVPPGLNPVPQQGPASAPAASASGATTFSSYSAGKGQTGAVGVGSGTEVVNWPASIHVEHDGVHRWLVIDAPPAVVWSKVLAFWAQQGFVIKRQDPKIGIMETGWMENRADVPQGFLRRAISKAFGKLDSAPTRDKYRVRLEPGAKPGTTELFLTHWGVREVVTGGVGAAQNSNTIWEVRPESTELEGEFLNRLIVFLGLTKEQAAQRMAGSHQVQAPRATLVHEPDGQAAINVKGPLPRTWQRTGVALDHLGFVVENSNAADGTYLVQATDPFQGLVKKNKDPLSKLSFLRDDKQQSLRKQRFVVMLTEDGDITRVRVTPKGGPSPNAEKAAAQILALLEQQLR